MAGSGLQIVENQTTLDHAEERRALAAAFRWAARFGFNEGVANHFSLAVSENGKRFLINPFARHFARLKASDHTLGKAGWNGGIAALSERRGDLMLIRHRLSAARASRQMGTQVVALRRLETVQPVVGGEKEEWKVSITAHSATFLSSAGAAGTPVAGTLCSASSGRRRCRPRKIRDITVPIGTSSTTAISLYSRPSTS